MSTATDMLANYLAAEQAILDGKEARVGDRLLRLEDLAEVRKGRLEWEQRVAAENAVAADAPRIGGIAFSHARLDR
jgi:hypothetical protein